jgi:hypothetical protein
MVSVTVDVVSVWLVMDPWVKFGITGTPFAVAADRKTATAPIAVDVIVLPKWVIS